MDIIAISNTKTVISSWKLTNRILPKRKLNKSRLNPLDKLIKTTPNASPEDSKTAMAESGGIFAESFNLVMPNAAKTETINAIHIHKYS
jgi:hypothetical protein